MPASEYEINLLANAGVDSKPLGKFLRWALSYGRYIIIGTQIIVLLAFFSRFKLDQDLSDLHEKVNNKTSIVTALSSVESNTRNLQNRLDILGKLESARSLYLQVIKTLAQETPSDVSLTQLIFNQNSLSMTGSATTNRGFGDFLTFIRRSGYFSQITLEEISRNSVTNTLNFKLSMQVQPIKAAVN